MSVRAAEAVFLCFAACAPGIGPQPPANPFFCYGSRLNMNMAMGMNMKHEHGNEINMHVNNNTNHRTMV